MKQASCLFCVAAITLLSGCASPAEDYPTLAIRDVERVNGTFVAPAPPPPAQPAPATLNQLDDIVASARSAHATFLMAAPQARTLASAANGATRGSESWSRAQVALADLEASRSLAMIALADLDRMFVDAMTGAQDIERIEAARSDVATLVEQQNATILSLMQGIAP